MPSIETLLQNNRDWAERTRTERPEEFQALSAEQHPRHCIVGCSDSRIPVHEMLGTQPGQMFVHRNIANLVSHTDLNCLSVLQFAVDVLKVERIIVCGHYDCGGVMAAMRHDKLGLADYWLHQLEKVVDDAAEDLKDLLPDRLQNRLCELNVLAQVENVVSTSIVRDAWRRGQALYVHGWIFSQETGRVTPLTDALSESTPSS